MGSGQDNHGGRSGPTRSDPDAFLLSGFLRRTWLSEAAEEAERQRLRRSSFTFSQKPGGRFKHRRKQSIRDQ